MNTKNLLLLASLVFAMPLSAQSPLEDFKRDITLSGSNYVAYRGPQKQLTPAPKGYKPFYLSHYGRHGSRYMIGKQAYDVPYFSLLKAKQEGKLTAKGEETLAKVKLIREEAKGRDGELTPLGALQHQGITKRMMERFPEIFAGNTNIEARSTVVIRCILSMENGLQQMLRMNPKLHIFHDASEHDMYYMNQGDRYLDSLKNSVGIKVVQQEFAQKHVNYSRVMQELFNDPAWVKQNINQSDLNRKLYEMASSVQGTELRGKVSLYDLFTEEELYQNWVSTNIWWQIAYGNSPYTGNVQPYSQRNLLMDIIEKADSCIALPHPGATLRYGHDTMVTPLTCLLDLNGYGEEIMDAVTGNTLNLETLEDGDAVYAWVGPAMALSLPPQSTASLIVGNIPADYAVPQYYEITSSTVTEESAVLHVAGSNDTITVPASAKLTPYLTKNIVTLADLRPGARILVWSDSKGTPEKVLVFAYGYRGYISVAEDGVVSVNGQSTTQKAKTTADGDTLLPIRAVAEALGMSVRWDAKQGAVVSYGDDMVKPAPLTTETLMTAMPGGAIAAVNSDGTTEEVYGTCVKEAGVTYVSRSALAQALDLYLAD